MSDEEIRLREQLATVTQERDALKRERREYGMALTQEELRDPEYMQGYCEDFGVDYHREVQARVNVEQQVWEEAAKKCHECLDMTRNDQITWAQEHLREMLHGRCQAFANLESYCLERAKKEQP